MPDGASSRALLIGVPDYESPELPQIPAVRNNLRALKEALSGQHGLFLPNHCRTLGSDGATVDQGGIGRELSSAGREAEDLLLVYYAGHGLLDDDGMLHLALTHTEPQNIGFTSLPFQLLKRELAQSRAKARVLVLDCCFSGRAVTAMSTPRDLLSGQLDLNGTYTLTSTTATTPSHAPPGAPYTTFTEALLSTLTEPEALTLDGIYREIDRKLTSSGLPPPQARSVNSASHLVLTRGPVKKPPNTPAPQHPPGPPEVRFSQNLDLMNRLKFALFGIGTLLSLGFVIHSEFKNSPSVLLFSIPFLLAGLAFTYVAFCRRGYLVIDGSGLKMQSHKRRPSDIPWQHVSYLGMLKNYSYRQGNGRTRHVQNVLVIRMQQHCTPPPGDTALYSKPFRKISSSLREIGYAGCRVTDIAADPVWLRQAMERLSGLAYRSDQELRDLDPRLSSRVSS